MRKKLAASFRVMMAFAFMVFATNIIVIAPVFAASTAVSDVATVQKNTATSIDVMANDTPANAKIKSVTVPTHGTVAVNPGDKSVTYTPATNYVGSDAFNYTIEDTGSNKTQSTATVSLSVVEPVINPVVTTVTWDGNGTEDPGCAAGQTAAFHWVLTPGGGADITAATLTVDYNNGADDIEVGDASGNGAVQFNTDTPAPDVVSGASAAITYIPGNGAANFVLTISDATCTGTAIDLCPTVPGNQLSITDCLPVVDVCPAIDGVQTNPLECLPVFDACPNIDGVQATPLECLPVIDVCPNVPGNQSSITDCLPQFDFCPNIDGVQTSPLECLPVIDVCPNVPGNQSSESECEEDEGEQVTLCHATHSSTNPFETITVSVSAAFHGHLNDGNGDHQDGEDIIPPFTYQGDTYSQNWPSGQATFDNDCVEPEEPPVVDVCPNITGNQASVPADMQKDDAGNCVTPGRGADTPLPSNTPTSGTVLSAVTTVPAAPQLADTGESNTASIFVAFGTMLLALGLGIASRKQLA